MLVRQVFIWVMVGIVLGCRLSAPGVDKESAEPGHPTVVPPEIQLIEEEISSQVRNALRENGDTERVTARVRELDANETERIRVTITGGAPMPVDLLLAVEVRFRKTPTQDGFGLLILPREFSQAIVDSAGGITGDYGRLMRIHGGAAHPADDLAEFFRRNYSSSHPLYIDRVIPFHFYEPSARKLGISTDELSMRTNNTYGFAPREVRDTGRWSYHTVGAVDINPFFNPVVLVTELGEKRGIRAAEVTSRDVLEGLARVEPLGALQFAFDRESSLNPHVIAGDRKWVAQFFVERGWSWGGRWNSLRDYQHFSPGDE